MLAREKPDMVAVCPRHVDQHAAMVTTAAESGTRGIYCEKPFARTPAEGDRVLTACERLGVKVVVAHHGRENPYLQWVERLLQEEIGPLRLLRGHGKGDRRAGAEDTAVLGTHVFDQMRFLAGDVVRGVRPRVAWWPSDRGARRRGGSRGARPARRQLATTPPTSSNRRRRPLQLVPGRPPRRAVVRPGRVRRARHRHGARPARGDVFRYPSGTWIPDEAAGRWERVSLPEWERTPEGAERTPQQKMTESNRRNALALVLAVELGGKPQNACSGRDAVAALEMVIAPAKSQRSGGHVPFPMRQRDNPYHLLRQGAPR